MHNAQSTDDSVLLIEVEEKDPPAQDTAPIREMRGRTANTTLENDQHWTKDALYCSHSVRIQHPSYVLERRVMSMGWNQGPKGWRDKEGCMASAVEAFLVQFPGYGSNIITLLNHRHFTLLEALQWLSVDSGVYLAILRWYNQSKTLFWGVYPRQNPKFVHYITLEGQCSFSGYPRYLGRPSVVSAFKNYSTPAQ